MTVAEQILKFNHDISLESVELPVGVRALNPFKGEHADLIRKIATAFYQKFYSDTRKRRLILGSTPSRRNTAATGIPFADTNHLAHECGIHLGEFTTPQTSSAFLYDVIREYGGVKKFYNDFYMNFVCPLGLVRANSKGNEVNCNYYENKELQDILSSFILDSIHSLIDFRIDTSICYCIGSGENYKFLEKLNTQHKLFDQVIPLEHPRFIMQYNSKRKEEYITKYLDHLMK